MSEAVPPPLDGQNAPGETLGIAPPPVPDDSPVPRIADFADWLSPMVVKELRQGLRTKVFVGAYIIVQVLMILFVFLVVMFSDMSADSAKSMSGVFMFLLGIFLLLIMPMRGLVAVSQEVNADTLELLYLSRLSAARIVAGKWLALVLQSLLLVSAVIPYVVLRYFSGGFDLLLELELIVAMLLASLFLTAVAVTLSTFGLILRVILVATILLGMLIFFAALMISLVASYWTGTSVFAGFETMEVHHIIFSLIAFIYVYPLALLFALEVGAWRVAAVAENHSVRLRLLSWLLFIPGPILLLAGVEPAVSLTFYVPGVVLLLVLSVTSMCETIHWIPSLPISWVKRGLLGRLAGRIMYPGWMGGILYSFISMGLIGLSIFTLPLSGLEQWAKAFATYISLIGTLFIPIALIRLFIKGMAQPPFSILIYGVIQVGFIMAFIFIAIAHQQFNSNEALLLLSVFPTSTFLVHIFQVNPFDNYLPIFALVNMFFTFPWLLVLIHRMWEPWKMTVEMEEAAEQLIAEQEAEEQEALNASDSGTSGGVING